MVVLSTLYEVKAGQFMLRIINVNETPVRLKRAPRVFDCKLTPFPAVMLDLPTHTLTTSVILTLGPPSLAFPSATPSSPIDLAFISILV